jgi:Ca2+-binding EF-hand superfamily protein
MMSKFLLGGAIAAIAATAAFAQSVPPAAKPGMHGRMMQTEARTDVAANVGKMFARLDTNRDGFITKAETDALEAKRSQRLEKRAEGFQPDKIFDRIDANHDGKITVAEEQAAHSARAQSKGKPPAQANATAFTGLFARADANKDGAVTRAEFGTVGNQLRARMEKAGGRHGFAGHMFEAADSNKDGKVSVPEAQALALQHFDRADLNHDGKLTPQERKQARQQLKAQQTPS